MANTALQSHKISPFPCAVIIHIRFGGYHLSQSAKGIGTPNSNTKILLLIQNAKCKIQNSKFFEAHIALIALIAHIFS